MNAERAKALHEAIHESRGYWSPITSATPIGEKIQLLGRGGMPAYGSHHPRCTFFTHWSPLPKIWLPISEATPIGVTLQLKGKGGVATYGRHSPRCDFFTHWAHLPKFRPTGPA